MVAVDVLRRSRFADTGVYDSSADFEQIIAERFPNEFNATNDENGTFDNRKTFAYVPAFIPDGMFLDADINC